MAAKMYSSGEIEYLWLPPIIIWGVNIVCHTKYILIQIKIGCKNTQLDLSIVDEIDGEDEDANATVDQVEHLDVDPHEGEDGDHEAEEDEDEENTEEDPTAQSEVNLGLKYCLW